MVGAVSKQGRSACVPGRRPRTLTPFILLSIPPSCAGKSNAPPPPPRRPLPLSLGPRRPPWSSSVPKTVALHNVGQPPSADRQRPSTDGPFRWSLVHLKKTWANRKTTNSGNIGPDM